MTADEAVVLLAENSGGSGLFFSLAIVQNYDGSPRHIATISLGDRVKVESLKIDDGVLVADLVEHGNEDPMCCPTTEVHREWRLEGMGAIEMDVRKRAKRGRFTGYLVWGHEVRSFKNCERDREGWVINAAGDELAEIYGELTSVPYQEMFVEIRGEWQDGPVEGFGADYPEAMWISDLIRAENEGFGCRRELTGFWYLASGNEPGWRLEIRADGMTMTTMDSTDDAKFPSAAIISEDDRVTFNANVPNAPVRVVLMRKRCVDTMSGARYSFEATVDVDGKQYTGCALKGL